MRKSPLNFLEPPRKEQVLRAHQLGKLLRESVLPLPHVPYDQQLFQEFCFLNSLES